MKKLVKTAKQQFEERLSELRVVERWELCPTEIYYGCEKPNGLFVLLRDQDGEYKELQYGMRYIDLLETESFLCVMAYSFIERQIPIRPLFDWYASADHEDEPFNLLDFYMCELEEEHHTFEDLYEEVPDVRIITAKEQWEKASANSILVQQSGDDLYKVEVTDTDIIFYTFRHGAYQKEIFPSFYELRNDSRFVIDYLSFVRDSHPDDMEAAFEWLSGRKYTMGDVTLLDIFDVANRKSVYCYEECSVNEVAKMDFANEAESLRKKLVSHIENLCELGLTVNEEVLCSRYALSCADGDALCTDPLEEIYTLKNDATEWILCYRTGVLETESYHLDKLSIDTLLHIIESLQ